MAQQIRRDLRAVARKRIARAEAHAAPANVNGGVRVAARFVRADKTPLRVHLSIGQGIIDLHLRAGVHKVTAVHMLIACGFNITILIRFNVAAVGERGGTHAVVFVTPAAST